MGRIQHLIITVATLLIVNSDVSVAESNLNALIYKERFSQKQSLVHDHIMRVDRTRLRTIDIGLDRLDQKITEGLSASAIFQGLSSVEANLYGLRLDPAAVKVRLNRVACMRKAVREGQRQTSCVAGEVSENSILAQAASAPSKIVISRLAQPRPSVGASLDTDDRKSFVIGIYGPSVDFEMGRFFSRLAKRDPSLLQPIPIARNYQIAACLSGAVSGLVRSDASAADLAFLNLLNQAADLVDNGNDKWRFTLRQNDLAEISARAGETVPETLAEFDAADAFRLITADFASRYGLTDLRADQLAALRNLWTAQGDFRFREIIAGAVGVETLDSGAVGPALARAGIRDDAVWPRVYGAAESTLHCRDADKVFEAYGLVYKNGDFPSARQVMQQLQDHLGYAAVPGVSVSQTAYTFLESQPQNCSAFGPVELLAGGASSDECNLRQISVNGRDRWEVQAGGVAIQFFVSEKQRGEILDVMREFEALPRGGDILRWRSTSRVPVSTQATDVLLMPNPTDELRTELPCIVSLSRNGGFEGTDALLSHIDDYREHFYLGGEPLLPGALSFVFVLDEFDGYLDSAFRRQWNDTIQSLTRSYQNLISLTDDAGGGAGQTRLPETAMLPLCSELAEQIKVISSDRDISHGAFVKSLLIGSATPLTEGMGLLNSKGDFAESEFESRLNFWPIEGDLGLVVESMVEARDMLRPDTIEELGPTIFNLSLGSSYRFADEKETATARKVVKEMAVAMDRWNDALFVVAAGQPDGTPSRGLKLKRVSALTADVDDPDCPFFPACLSTRSNVITVGAVRPSASRLAHKRPVLIPWSNYGSAVSVAAPGASVMSKEFGFIANDADLIEALSTTTVRDGTSIAAVFVTALAARMAAEHPELSGPEIKRRLIATSQPYIKPGADGGEVLFEGDMGDLYAGVIDPEVALLNPNRYHVRWKTPPAGAPDLQEFETLLFPEESTPFAIFSSERERGRAELKCRWADIYRIHIAADIGEPGAPLFFGGVACKNEVRGELIEVGFGPLGTKISKKQHECLVNGVCFKGVTKDGEVVQIDFADVRDIYFRVVGR